MTLSDVDRRTVETIIAELTTAEQRSRARRTHKTNLTAVRQAAEYTAATLAEQHRAIAMREYALELLDQQEVSAG